jgi:3-oxoadipate enol-lactonase
VPAGPYPIGDLGADVLALLDRLAVGSAYFVGLSLGGMTGMWLGQAAPDRIRGLVLCCTSARPGNRPMWIDRAAKARTEGMAEIAEGGVGRWFTPAWIEANPEQAQRMREMIAGTPAEGYASCCDTLADLDLVPDLPRITVPALVIAGADDKALPPEHSKVIADGIPGARFEVVDQAAHLGNFEQPRQFTRLITEHLEAIA